jgi:hypothetical protein
MRSYTFAPSGVFLDRDYTTIVASLSTLWAEWRCARFVEAVPEPLADRWPLRRAMQINGGSPE